MTRHSTFKELPIRRMNDESGSEQMALFEITRFKEEGGNLDFTVEPHRHDYYHIMYIKQGVGEHYIDFKTYDIQPKSFFFISPGQVHSLQVSANVSGYVLSFNADFYQFNTPVERRKEFPFFHSVSNAPVVYLSGDNHKIEDVLTELYEEFSGSASDRKKMIRSLMDILLIRISRQYNQHPLKEGQPVYLTEQLRKLDFLIDTHFKTHKLVNDYAEFMHISPKHLNSLCKTGLNKTVTNLIHERTLTEARRLLLFTGNSITEIAFELGFTDKSYFMRFFKKHMGQTAETYRQHHTS